MYAESSFELGRSMVTVEYSLCGRQAPEDALRVLPFIYSAILACTPEKDVIEKFK